MSQAGSIKSYAASDTPAVPTSFTADTGNAIPTSNNLEIYGGTNIATSGAGKVLTLTIDGAIAATNGGTSKSTYAVGDILYADTTTTLASLAIGAESESLTLAGGVPTWAAAGGAGEWELITTATPSAASTVEFTDLVDAEYRISFENVVASDTSARLAMRASNDNGSTFSTDTDYSWSLQAIASAELRLDSQIDDFMLMTHTTSYATISDTEGVYGDIFLYRVNQTAEPIICSSTLEHLGLAAATSANTQVIVTVAVIASTDASGNMVAKVNAIQLLYEAGETLTGTIKLFKKV